ncbi:hypothetical protein PL321_01465 [Caloramator sp. mosi_1]|uniref:hypothetical protein n=1 Tax=Caloramator sp. mosi_1 TaxID=3023090 RepID=UPI00235FE272|nr:hypothetical protein [Caloramator sp. mosi_1]WDC84483.1 hypothetical protein PL321_01465 [Caloramator sp. mosi_1]
MKVYYDRVHDIVSLYFDMEDVEESVSCDDNTNKIKRDYDFDEAASLILDMVDVFDKNGRCVGFRVFNASKYYDINLLNSAEEEVLSEENVKLPEDKVIARFSNGQIIT